jgi:N utilization substance protein A
VFVKKIKPGTRGPQIIVSRTVAEFVKRLFEIEVPEIASGFVEIKAIVREAGYRTKMAVSSTEPSIDAVGACVGNRGLRVNAIVSELGGEKIDIIPWCEDQLEFVARSLSPAKVVMVQANEGEKVAKVAVMDDMLSLAIGKDGQNARLAARLTGWKIDVKPYSQFIKQEEIDSSEADSEEQESSENTLDTESSFDDFDDFDLDDLDAIDQISQETTGEKEKKEDMELSEFTNEDLLDL